MKNKPALSALLLLLAFGVFSCSSADSDAAADQAQKREEKILVFSKTSGYRHESIPAGKAALLQLGKEHQVRVDTTENAAVFTADSLAQYAAVVFLNTTEEVLNAEQQRAFEKYIRSGKGFVGVHAATDTEYDWPWYNKLVGAYFASHPEVQQAAIDVLEKNHPATAHLPDRWERQDEWYNFKSMNPDVHVLANLDENSYKGGGNGAQHPVAWYHEYDGGRSFYTALGHTQESYSEELFLRHLWGGVRYAIGD
ncbi:ThuA domain-containing protein [Pontibacter litorisediminis]|uniref:ThuA domain-containing protein n=1 Tax=Pontibacter litorisediminis TaxID=1846260 RepID=UPI0023EBCD41|nr:ThuA domain-containing protein [Pontibacter litorisediminis]